MEFFILAALIGLIPACIANNKGHSFLLWWFFGAMLWIIAFPCSIIISSKYVCPYCKEGVKSDAIICKHCHKNIK